MRYLGLRCTTCNVVRLRSDDEATLADVMFCDACGGPEEFLSGGSYSAAEVGLFNRVSDIVHASALTRAEERLLSALVEQALTDAQQQRALDLIALRIPGLDGARRVLNEFPQGRFELLRVLGALLRD